MIGMTAKRIIKGMHAHNGKSALIDFQPILGIQLKTMPVVITILMANQLYTSQLAKNSSIIVKPSLLDASYIALA